MRRNQIAFQIAMLRERTYWLGGYWVFLSLAVIGAARRKPDALSVLIIPYSAYSTMTLYMLDFAWFTKPNRINEIAQEVQHDTNYWFVPLLPTSINEVPGLENHNKSHIPK
jgi:hypothetical protein